eukprot:SAG31_NODE_126_length_23665_cov_6.178987_18_plen_151_part_00
MRMPYLLPTMCSAAFCIVGFGLSWLLPAPNTFATATVSEVQTEDSSRVEGDAAAEVDELVPLTGRSLSDDSSRRQAVQQTDNSKRRPMLSMCTGDGARTVRLCIGLDLMRSFYVLGDDNMFPLLAAAPRSAGGLDYSSTDIGAHRSAVQC